MSNPLDSTELREPRSVLVLGDIMLDQTTWGRAERVSLEAPVLEMQAALKYQGDLRSAVPARSGDLRRARSAASSTAG
jgi:hypothetical protein